MSARAGTNDFLEVLGRVAGPEAVEALCAACGGLRVYIPHRRVRRAKGSLARAFGGLDAATAIVTKLNEAGISGVNINVPLRRRDPANTIKDSLREALLAGHSVAEVARTNRVTERTVYLYRRELVAEHQLTKRPS